MYDLVICCRTFVRSTGNDPVVWVKTGLEQKTDMSKKGVTLQHPLIQKRLEEGGYELAHTEKRAGHIVYRYKKAPTYQQRVNNPADRVNPLTGKPAPMLRSCAMHT